MNSATLTTETGHTWSTSIGSDYESAKDYFLGKSFPVGSFDETKPNEGYEMQRVVKMEFTEEQIHQGFTVPVTTICTV